MLKRGAEAKLEHNKGYRERQWQTIESGIKLLFAAAYGDEDWHAAAEPAEPVREWCGMDPSAMSVEQLRRELGDRGLDRSGDRGQLAQRLQKALPYSQEERREANQHIEALVEDHSSSSGSAL